MKKFLSYIWSILNFTIIDLTEKELLDEITDLFNENEQLKRVNNFLRLERNELFQKNKDLTKELSDFTLEVTDYMTSNKDHFTELILLQEEYSNISQAFSELKRINTETVHKYNNLFDKLNQEQITEMYSFDKLKEIA